MSKQKTLHVLGLSGGKDSAALALYMDDKLRKAGSDIHMHYYFTDTGKELPEVKTFIDKVSGNLHGGVIDPYHEVFTSNRKQKDFDYHLEQHKNYLPSPQARWCTIQMKLVPFQKWVEKKMAEDGYTDVVSYVGIRADEPERGGFVTNQVTDQYMQIKMPFREDGITRDGVFDILQQADLLADDPEVIAYRSLKQDEFGLEYEPTDEELQEHFLSQIAGIKNKPEHPYYESNLTPDLLRKIVETMDKGLPGYYGWRSRSGCTFCFYQQKIEWLRLMSIYPKAYEEAKSYEKTIEQARPDGTFYWLGQNTPLSTLESEERQQQIEENHQKRYDRFVAKTQKRAKRNPLKNIIYFSDNDVMDELYDQAEGGGACVTCYK